MRSLTNAKRKLFDDIKLPKDDAGNVICSICRDITGRDRLTWLDHIYHTHPRFYEELSDEQRIKRARQREEHARQREERVQQGEEYDQEREQYQTPEEVLDEAVKNIDSAEENNVDDNSYQSSDLIQDANNPSSILSRIQELNSKWAKGDISNAEYWFELQLLVDIGKSTTTKK